MVAVIWSYANTKQS